VILRRYKVKFTVTPITALLLALHFADRKIKATETFDTLLQSGLLDPWKDRINKEVDLIADDF
jgi:hypothetical protein